MKTVFDGCYYTRSCGRPYARDEHWLKFFGEIAARISDFATQHVYDPVKPFCRQASVTEPLKEHYDLIVCIRDRARVTARAAEACAQAASYGWQTRKLESRRSRQSSPTLGTT